GGRALPRLALVAFAVNASRALLRCLLARRPRGGVGEGLARERVVERLLRRPFACRLAGGQLCLQGRALDVAQRLVIHDDERGQLRQPGLRALEDAARDARAANVASIVGNPRRDDLAVLLLAGPPAVARRGMALVVGAGVGVVRLARVRAPGPRREVPAVAGIRE